MSKLTFIIIAVIFFSFTTIRAESFICLNQLIINACNNYADIAMSNKIIEQDKKYYLLVNFKFPEKQNPETKEWSLASDKIYKTILNREVYEDLLTGLEDCQGKHALDLKEFLENFSF